MDYHYEPVADYDEEEEQLYASIGKNAHRSLIKPVAFKPMLPPQPPPSRYVSTPQGPPLPMSARSSDTASNHSYHGNMRSVHSSPGSANSSIHSPPGSQGGYRGPSPQGSQVYSVVDHRSHNHSHDDGYASQDYHSHSNSNASQGSVTNGSNCAEPGDRGLAVTYVSDFHSHMQAANNNSTNAGSKLSERPDCYMSSTNVSHVSTSSAHGDGYLHTPSPSDSGVGEVEALIREKEAELTKMRNTMERNEQAILQVYQERKQNWAMEMKELNEEWEKRLKFQQQKAFKTEQGLLMQLFKLQQERKSLKSDMDQLVASKEEIGRSHNAVKEECEVLKGKLEEMQWELQQKAGEISLLKSQLKDAKEESVSKSSDMLDLKSQLKESEQVRDNRNEEVQWLKAECERTNLELQNAKDLIGQTQRQLDQLRTCNAVPQGSPPGGQSQDALQQEVSRLKEELVASKANHQQQYEQWLEEKNKVIRYQKHLQLNYTQMHRKNKMLEAEIEQLTLELENRDIQLNDVHASAEERESMC